VARPVLIHPLLPPHLAVELDSYSVISGTSFAQEMCNRMNIVQHAQSLLIAVRSQCKRAVPEKHRGRFQLPQADPDLWIDLHPVLQDYGDFSSDKHHINVAK
jgi:hypothetical protein